MNTNASFRPRRARRPWTRKTPWLVLFILLNASTAPAGAENVRISFANDFLTSNPLADELYTGALQLDFDLGSYRLTFGENMFTDSENDVRFDETYLAIERDLPDFGPWRSTVQAGVVHVGRGLLGESAQNSLHRLIGDNEVDIAYVDSNRYHPTLRLRFHRPLRNWHRTSLSVHGEMYEAFDFKRHAQSGVTFHWPGRSFASFTAGLGARYTDTNFEALERRISSLAPTWEAGLRFRNSMSLSWTYNEFGTRSQHFTLGYDVAWKKEGRNRV